jgi:hypothetical protein
MVSYELSKQHTQVIGKTADRNFRAKLECIGCAYGMQPPICVSAYGRACSQCPRDEFFRSNGNLHKHTKSVRYYILACLPPVSCAT